MIITSHAIDQLYERYEKWGLDIPKAIEILKQINLDSDDNFKMVIFEDIPVILATEGNKICTFYPHPIDAAEDCRELIHKKFELIDMVRDLKSKNKDLYKVITDKQDYIDKQKRKLKNKNKKLKKTWR